MANVLSTFYSTIPTSLYTGYSLKQDYMPDTPIKCISLVLDTTSTTKYFGQKDTLNNPIITMTVRSDDYSSGYGIAEAIRNYFDMYADSTLLSVTASGSVIPLGKNSQGHREFLVQFNIIVKE